MYGDDQEQQDLQSSPSPQEASENSVLQNAILQKQIQDQTKEQAIQAIMRMTQGGSSVDVNDPAQMGALDKAQQQREAVLELMRQKAFKSPDQISKEMNDRLYTKIPVLRQLNQSLGWLQGVPGQVAQYSQKESDKNISEYSKQLEQVRKAEQDLLKARWQAQNSSNANQNKAIQGGTGAFNTLAGPAATKAIAGANLNNQQALTQQAQQGLIGANTELAKAKTGLTQEQIDYLNAKTANLGFANEYQTAQTLSKMTPEQQANYKNFIDMLHKSGVGVIKGNPGASKTFTNPVTGETRTEQAQAPITFYDKSSGRILSGGANRSPQNQTTAPTINPQVPQNQQLTGDNGPQGPVVPPVIVGGPKRQSPGGPVPLSPLDEAKNKYNLTKTSKYEFQDLGKTNKNGQKAIENVNNWETLHGIGERSLDLALSDLQNGTDGYRNILGQKTAGLRATMGMVSPSEMDQKLDNVVLEMKHVKGLIGSRPSYWYLNDLKNSLYQDADTSEGHARRLASQYMYLELSRAVAKDPRMTQVLDSLEKAYKDNPVRGYSLGEVFKKEADLAVASAKAGRGQPTKAFKPPDLDHALQMMMDGLSQGKSIKMRYKNQVKPIPLKDVKWYKKLGATPVNED